MSLSPLALSRRALVAGAVALCCLLTFSIAEAVGARGGHGAESRKPPETAPASPSSKPPRKPKPKHKHKHKSQHRSKSAPGKGQATGAGRNAAEPVIDGPVFNDPADLSGGAGRPSAGQAAVMNQLIRLTDRVPAGGEIEFVMFEFADGDRSTAVLDALLAAHRRGVHVKVVLDSSSPGALARFRQAFGAGKDRASWAVACPAGRGCIGRDYLHSKFALFSSVVVGGKEHRNVVFQTSSNLKDWYLYNSFNDSFTVADARAYADYRRYFADLRARKPDSRYFWRGPAGARYRALFYPGAQDPSRDPVANDLRRVQCRYEDGGGTARRTAVRIALTAFTKHRLDVARQLRALRDQGCSVDIVHPGPAGGPSVAPEVLKALNPAGRAPIRLTPCRFDPGNGQAVSTHTKVMMIDGSFGGDLTPRVYTGSANFTHLENSDDSALRVTGRAAHDAYRTWFGKLRAACGGGR
ncbi:hypothetical protein GCM10009801_43150 [Streptomyces albiaxialis]|uniref:PLD phosphodiesterase domain-containing protein n=1 Tax=Streptomyces albiaxialis TaxID=329523 RepID=A0ABN2W785_9ACTN